MIFHQIMFMLLYLLAQIKADVETKGQLIKHLIQKVQWSSFTIMEDVLTFVDWLDGELSTLVRLIINVIIVKSIFQLDYVVVVT